jgi:TonB family protein
MFLLLMFKIYKLNRLTSKQKGLVQADGNIILYNTGFGPGSWMRYIFLPDEVADETIIRHESEHVRLKHSWDIILFSLVQVFYWPNIFLFWIKKELVQIHEFQADAAVKMDETAYSHLLLSTVFNTCTPPLSHSFIIHPLKRRIMMLKKSNGKTPYVAAILACITGAFLVFNFLGLQSCKRKGWEANSEKSAAPIALTAMPVVCDHADILPKTPYDMMQYLATNLKYPEEAMKNGIEGRVIVHFVIDENGAVRGVRANSNGQNEVFLNAAIDVIKNMPAWIPGEKDGKRVAVEMVQPISFKL